MSSRWMMARPESEANPVQFPMNYIVEEEALEID
jgi:hypothetical protein